MNLLILESTDTEGEPSGICIDNSVRQRGVRANVL